MRERKVVNQFDGLTKGVHIVGRYTIKQIDGLIMRVYMASGYTEKGKEQKDVCLIDGVIGCIVLGSFKKERREQKGVYLINCLTCLCLSERWTHK